MRKYLHILTFLVSYLAAVPLFAQCPTAEKVELSFTDATCAGANDGTITVVLNDAVGPFGFQLYDLILDQYVTLAVTRTVSPANKVVFSRVPPSSYAVAVFKSGCNSPNPALVISNGLGIIVSEPAPLTLAVTAQTNITGCFGDATGSFSVKANGGNGSYQYAVSGGTFGTASTFSNLTAGTYTVQVKDAKDCTQDISVEITQPTQLTAAVTTQVNPNCNGTATGSITVSAAGGTPGYEYAINNGSFSATSVFSNLVAGNYTIQVRDSKGCLVTLPVITLTEPPVLTLTLTSKADITTCFGDNTGEIVVTAAGGTAGYEYSVNSAAFAAGTGTFSNLTAGSYTIAVRDANGCSTSLAPVTIAQPTQVAISLVSKKDIEACFGDGSGEIVVAASGGTAGYEYSINSGAFTASASFSGLVAGDYSIQVKDSKGCVATLPTITLIQPIALSASLASQINPTCFGNTNGSITLTITGGTPGYEYSINSGSFTAGSGSFNGLTAGDYTITVRDSKNCQITLPIITLTQPDLLAITLTSTTQITGCFGEATGQIITAVNGGVPGYEYSINSGAFAAESGSFTNLPAGTYTIVVRDANGCTATLPAVTLTQPDQIAISLVSTTNVENCNGETTGEIVVAASGGTPGYEYSIDGTAFVANSGSFTGLTAGTHTVTVRDSKGCQVSLAPVTITQPAALTASISAQTNITCNGTATGSITVSAAGGTPGYEYAINNGSFSATSVFSNLVAGNYTIQVRDSKGCLVTLPVITLTEPPVLTLTLTSKADITTCFGDNTGEIVVTAAGGTAGYEYSVNSAAFAAGTGTFSNLTAGSYTIAVRDANGCSTSLAPVTIAQPTQVAISLVSKKDIEACFGDGSGEIVVAASGGTAGYEYSINSGAFTASASFSGLVAGDYSIQVKDSKGCVATLPTITLIQPNALTISLISKIDVLCKDGINGSIEVTAAGGSPDYTYSINGGSFTNNSTFSNLPAGNYTIEVQDAKGCTTTLATQTITEPAQLILNLVAKTDPGCNGENTGSLTVTASGGTAAYEYSINGGSFGSSGVFNTLSAGTYTIRVRDANGCTAELAPQTLTDPTILSVSVSAQTDPSCNSGNDASITINGAGGTAPYEYAINNGGYSTSNVFSGLTAGTYTVSVKDAKGCTATMSGVVVAQPSAIMAYVASTNQVTCAAGTNGSISLSVSGGNAPYTYTINGGTSTAFTGTISNLSAGNYTIVINDANNCTVSLPVVTITEPAALTLVVSSQTDINACTGTNSGSVTVVASGGTAAYLYAIDGGSFSGNTTFSNLSSGNHTVQVRDANNCTAQIPITITTTPGVLTATADKTDPTCNGNTDGTITISNVSGGSGSYAYSLDGSTFQDSPVFASLPAGNYTVTVVDKNTSSCIITIPVDLVAPATITASATSTNPTGCGVNNGSITVSASGGSGSYTYSLDGSTFVNSATFSNLAAGNYTITVKDANACTYTLPVTNLVAPSSLVVNLISKTDVKCNGENSGSISVAGSGGTSPYTYAIDGITFVSSNIFSNLAAGTYDKITVKDANGCIVVLPAQSILQPTLLTISLTSKTDPGCSGGNTGSILVAVNGGVSPYSYSINGSSFTSGTGTFSNLAAGDYTIQVQDANNCTVSLPTVSLNSTTLTAVVEGEAPTGCSAQDGSITVSSVSGGSAPYQYSLDGTTFSTDNSFANLSDGSYTVYIRDNAGCQISQSQTLTSAGGLTARVTPMAESGCGNNDGMIMVSSVSGGSTPYNFYIDLAGNGVFVANPIGINSNLFTELKGKQSYRIRIEASNGCSYTSEAVTIPSPCEPTCNLTASVQSKQDVTCHGASDGRVSVQVSGGSGSYEYSINGTDYQTVASFTGLAAGSYTIHVRDVADNTCSTSLTATLSQPQALTATLSTSNPTTCSNNDGSITIVTIDGGTAPYSYSLDNTTFQTATTFPGMANGSYTVYIKDAKDCAITVSANLTSVPGFTATASTLNVTCNGATDGSIIVDNVSGGSGNYEYSLDGTTFQNGATFTDLASGNYTVTIRDISTTCITTVSVVVNQPALLAISLTAKTNVTGCNGASNGKIETNVSGGTSPYTYSVNGVDLISSTGVFNDLPAGTYTIIVKDANGCTATLAPQEITQPTVLSISLASKTDITCGSGNDGSITVSANGGSGSYTYSIDGTTFINSATFANLAAGTYSIIVKDASACTAVLNNIEISSSSTITATVTAINPSSCESKDGMFTISNVTGGTAPYSYSLDGTNYQSSQFFIGLSAGSYVVYIKDAKGCVTSQPRSLTTPNGVVATAIIADETDCNLADGSITINASGSTGYTYYINGNPNPAGAGESVFSGLMPAIYTIKVVDANNCEFILSNVTVGTGCTPTCTLAATAQVNNVLCASDDNGSIVLTTTGGTAPYTYSRDGVSFVNTSTFAGLAAGDYTFIIRDAANCEVTVTATVTEPAALTAVVEGEAPTGCSAQDGSITVSSVSGGSAPYQYSLDGTTFSTDNSFANLSDGSYTVYIRDNAGCQISQSQTLTSAGGLTARVTPMAESGCGNNDGMIMVSSVSGGSTPYNFYIDLAGNGVFVANPIGINSNLFTELKGKQSYRIRIEASNGCSYTSEAVTIPSPCEPTCNLTASVQSKQDVTCHGASDGRVSVQVSGGSGSYEYSINGTDYQTVASFTGLAAGSYTIHVRDVADNTCSTSLTATLSQPQALAINLTTKTDVTGCNGNTNGSITVGATGGTADYTYSLDGIIFSASNTFNALQAGIYNTITVKDANGCTAILPAVTITQPDAITADITGSNPTTCSATDGTITISNTSGGSGTFEFSVDGATYQDEATFSSLPDGDYTITIRDKNNTTCFITKSWTLNSGKGFTATASSTAEITCGANDGTITVAVKGGQAPFQYFIDGVINPDGAGNEVFSSLAPNTYTIQVVSNDGCSYTLTATVNACTPVCNLTAEAYSTPVLCDGVNNGTAILVNVSGGSGTYEYSVNSGVTYQNNPNFSSLAAGTYTILVRDKNNPSCIASFPVVVGKQFNVSGVIVVNNPEACQDRGSIEFRSVAGGTAPYTYSVDGTNFSSTDVFSNLLIGTYPATIKDANGCTFTTTVEIKGATPLTGNAVLSKPITCSTDANGEITITVNGGKAPYQYAINGAAFVAGNGVLTGLAAGTYTISVKDASNCIITLADVVITAPSAITASIADRTNPTCISNNGSITVTASGGSGTLTYSIDNGNTFVSNNIFTNLGEGSYTLMVKDANGCIVTLPVVTLTIPAITATISGSNPANCTTANGSITVNVTSGTAPYTYSLDGTTYQNEATFAGLTGGSYTVFIKDGAGCQISLTQDLLVAGGITAVTLNTTAETACGANNGTIKVGTITGAVGPYQYFIDDVLNTNDTFTGLAPKTYSIRVVATNGCTFTTSATVNNACVPTCDLTARIISSPVLCDGQANGTAELIEITGGSGRYAYSIDGITFQDSPNFANLAAGTYTITIRDKNNTSCTASFSTTVTSKFNVSGIIVVTEPKTCNDKGSIEFSNVSGGTADYAFSVDGNTFGPNTIYANLDPGIYPATIRDANNCRFSVNITVRGVEPITARVTQSAPVSCSGENDGKIKIEDVKGGSGTFVYSLDGTTFSGTQEFTGLKGGDYTVYIKDQSENSTCINTFKVTVAEPAKMIVALTPKNPSTCSVSDGEIAIQVTAGGVAPFTYKLNNGSFQTESAFTGLAGGDYTITVRSANGCIATFTQSLKVANAIAAKAEVVSSASCSGKQDGSARIFDVTGGSGSYEYSIDGITYQASSLFTNLAANTYVLYVRDKNQTNGCTASYPVIVTEAAQIVADVTKKDPSTCTSTDGEINIGIVSGGTADYLYSLDNITFENRKTFSGLSNGTYTIYVKDSKGCIAQYTRTLASPNAVTVGIPTIVQPTCKGGNDGELTMNTVTNGIAPYEYSIDGIIYQSSAKFTSLKAGKYTVNVKDASGCIYAFSYELLQPEGLNYQISNIAASACGEATGKMEITNISGGTAPYLFSIDGTNFQGSTLFENLTAGQYELFIRDNTPSGCVVKDVFTIPGTTAITYKVDSVSIGCEGGNKGRIVVYGIKGGNKPYQVSLDNGITWQFVQNDSIAYNDLAPKAYQLIIKYGASCQTAVRNINIYSGGLPVGVATTAATCGSANGSATAVMADASKKYFYSIDNSQFQESPVFLDLKAGKYTMYVRESANDLCPKQTEFAVAGPDSLTYDLEKVDCFDVRVLNIKGGTSPYRVSLDGGKTFVSGYIFPQSPNYLASNLAPGEYSIVVADDAGCSTLPVRVRIDNKITAKVTATLSLPDEPTGEIKITDIRGGNAPYEVSTDGRNWAVVKDKTLPIDTVITTQPMGKYVVYIRDANGCVKEYETEIKESKFTIPNIFTPNGDGVNDTFFIRNLPTGTFVTISNRWGKIIYTSNNYQNDWSGEGYAEGIYFFTVNIAAQGQFNGWVEIKR